MHSLRYWHHEQCMAGCGWWRLLAMDPGNTDAWLLMLSYLRFAPDIEWLRIMRGGALWKFPTEGAVKVSGC